MRFLPDLLTIRIRGQFTFPLRTSSKIGIEQRANDGDDCYYPTSFQQYAFRNGKFVICRLVVDADSRQTYIISAYLITTFELISDDRVEKLFRFSRIFISIDCREHCNVNLIVVWRGGFSFATQVST